REGERPARRDLGGLPPRPVRDEFDDPLADPLVEDDASARELDEDRDPDPDERSREDVRGPVQTEIDAAYADEGRKRDRGTAGPRDQSGIAKRARMYVPPSAVMRTMTRSKVALVPARLSARKRSSSTPPIEANIWTGCTRQDSQRSLKFRSTTDNPQTFHRDGRREMNRASR